MPGNNEADYEECLKIATNIYEDHKKSDGITLEEIDKEVLKKTVLYSAA